MKKTGAWLTVYALEQIGVRYTYGIPGVHNTEIYDELNNSEQIEPVLVTHEGGGAFMADGLSRTSDTIGTLVIVPAAGTTHALSGIGEAFLDGIPMLVISGGTRRDSGRHYQLHQLDLEGVVGGITKGYYLVEDHRSIVPAIYEAYRTAVSGEPGPVFVEIPVELQLFRGEVDELPVYSPAGNQTQLPAEAIQQAMALLLSARRPGLYLGWGAVDATEPARRLAEQLAMPVATTLQGLSAFPGNHPLHAGVGFGPSALPSARKAFADCDVLLAVGVRFSELATGSYGMEVPAQLIHIDINPEVFHKNYPAAVTIEGDASQVLWALLAEMESKEGKGDRSVKDLSLLIRTEKEKYFASWRDKTNEERVSPGHFFHSLRQAVPDDTYVVVDDGKHTFLTAELFPVYHPRHFISPTDFNCMGYCVPAAIGVKMGHPDQTVVAIVGDGAFLMTGMELLTATTLGLGVIVFVFHDGELGQISQFQKIPLNRKTATVIGQVKMEGVAIATGARFLRLDNDTQIESVIDEALQLSKNNRPVLVDVRIDYSRRTLLTKGVVKTNLSRFPLSEKIRFLARALKRHTFG